MPLVLIPILIIVGIFAVSAGGDIIKNLDFPFFDFRLFPEKAVEKALSQSTPAKKATIQQAPSGPSPPPFLLDTQIISGPQEGALLSSSTTIIFQFSGSVIPQNTQGRMNFETRVEGFDENWKATSSTQRKITLPSGPKEYTFLVRSRLSGFVDQTPASRTFSVNVSPYFGRITIAELKTATRSSPSLITITGKLSPGETANLTGWTIKGKAGSFKIPFASKTVDPGLSLNLVYPVELKPSGKVLISSARGPFGLQSNFQPNKCMAYLRPTIPFPISVPRSCKVTKPTEAQMLFFSLTCQNYILNKINYSSCTPPTLTGTNEVTLDRECMDYLDNLFEEFTYQGCVQRSENDFDFLKNEWHLYMNTDLLTQRVDAIELLDQNNLLVARKTY